MLISFGNGMILFAQYCRVSSVGVREARRRVLSTAREGTSAAVIWSRFPKLILGFIAASLLVPFVFSAATANAAKPVTTNLRKVWFSPALFSVGSATAGMTTARGWLHREVVLLLTGCREQRGLRRR